MFPAEYLGPIITAIGTVIAAVSGFTSVVISRKTHTTLTKKNGGSSVKDSFDRQENNFIEIKDEVISMKDEIASVRRHVEGLDYRITDVETIAPCLPGSTKFKPSRKASRR